MELGNRFTLARDEKELTNASYDAPYIRPMKKQFCLLALLFLSVFSFGQQTGAPSIFDRITAEMKEFRPDTSAVPDDKITRRIMELRALRGGFNIDEAIQFKLAEEAAKGEVPKDQMDKLTKEFTTGHGKQLLDNAVTWIYRRAFTYKELKHLVRFYKTPAGQKMAADFPIIMLQSLAAAELIHKKIMD